MGVDESVQHDLMKISCKCGEVCLTSCESQLRFLQECACRDCCLRIEWAISNGADAEMPTKYGPVFQGLAANCFVAVEGLEKLEVYKMREESKAVLFVCSDCKSIVVIDHKDMSPNNCIVPLDTCQVECYKKYKRTDALMRN